ncbi:nose resistant to fluoxetine protein 6-like [Chelonus insularis]|uniref:nose resistant to fluoxetine protein 6-like n=1 Tax=Chelonus insularis TaxID=460826 RepID=UPI0015892240|nr:nose resistant to fluoxetine protein 6-like [Chelonus insularis]
MSFTDTTFIFIVITTLSIVSLINGQIFTNNYHSNNNSYDIYNLTRHVDIVDIINGVQKTKFNVLATDNFKSVQKLVASTADNECNQQLDLFKAGIMKKEFWALKMLDASSKIPAGILNGFSKDLGMYDECLSIQEVKDNFTIRGRQCMYKPSIGLPGLAQIPFQLSLSVCVPSICTPEQVKEFLESILKSMKIYLSPFVNTSAIQIQSVSCISIEPKPWSTGGIITLSILGIFIGFLTICTINDILMRSNIIQKTDNVIMNGLAQFSFYSNSLRILSTKTPKGTLPSIAGLRFFSMAWVVLGHNYVMPFAGSIINLVDIGEWVHSWDAVYILIAPFAVDSFFVMSGFLTAYLFLKEMSSGHKFNIITYYIHRYLRLTPALGILILLTIYIFPHFGSGALWDENISSQSEICSKSWWRLLLYIQNYSAAETMGCLGHTWYLSVDMHFFWLSPIILYPLAKRPKIGLYILSSFIVASFIVPAVIANMNKYSAALYPTDLQQLQDMMINFYVTSHTRAGPWLLGVFCGYKLHTTKGTYCKKFIILGWILAVLAFAFCFFTLRIFQHPDYKYDIYWETFYAGCSRHIWAFGVCWIIYTSAIGYGGIIKNILSFSIFLPFSRISYCIYLIHFINEAMKASATRVPGYFSDFQMINIFFSDFVLNILAAFVFTLCFESPFLVLEKMILKGNKQRQSANIIQNEGMKNSSVENGTDNYAFKEDEASHSNDLLQKLDDKNDNKS